MSRRYSLTVQVAKPSLNPLSPGHVAVVINEPSGQTYAGFGPEHHGRFSDKAKFDVRPVLPGNSPARDYSNVLGDDEFATFTIPISEDQVRAALDEIERIKRDEPQYNATSISDPRICTTIASRIMQAAGLGPIPSIFPARNFKVLSDIADTLASNPMAAVASRSAIPNGLRGIQRDYAYIGGGFDTPSERVSRVRPEDQSVGSPNQRRVDDGASSRPSLLNPAPMDPGASGPFGTGGQFVPGSALSSRPLYNSNVFGAQSEGSVRPDAAKDVRVLSRRLVGNPEASVFDTGAPTVPFVSSRTVPAPDAQSSFSDRFGNWVSSPQDAPPASYEPAASPQSGRSAETDPRDIRILSRVSPNSSASAVQPPPGVPNQPMPQARPARQPGLMTGLPMLPPSVFGLPDPSTSSGDNMDDWFARWVKPFMEQ